MYLDPIQNGAPARSVQLEAVYLKALLYTKKIPCFEHEIEG